MTRAEHVAEAQRLKSEGLIAREIAVRMGVARTTVQGWLTDPDLSKQRKRREGYAGTCADCGRATDGSNGPSAAPTHCDGCRRTRQNAEARERHLSAVREFVRRHGEPPSATDWNPSLARAIGRPDKAVRFYRDGCYPHVNAVQGVWGSWRVFLAAAGYPDKRIRHNRPGDDPAVIAETVRLYVDEGLPGTEIARRLGMSATGVYHRLEAAGVQRRPRPWELKAAA